MLQQVDGTNQWVIESDQGADIFYNTVLDGHLALRLCSVRCQEAQVDNAPNQDFARLLYIPDAPGGSSLIFCVCDGVGSSYQGNFAARYLATRLTNALQALPTIPRTPNKVALSLRSQMELWAVEARSELQRLSLPAPALASALEREIIEEQRDRYGSATVFLAGRIDYGRSFRPLFAPWAIQAMFCWMGNVTGSAYIAPNVQRDLGDLDNDRNRWSTHLGQQGLLTLRITTLNKTEPLVIHTDGLDTLKHDLARLDDHQLKTHIQQLLRQPSSDDMTLLELRWGSVGGHG